jgi:hypothetical protein
METTLKIKGKILFDPPDKTTKHRTQGSWKKVAYIDIPGDICEYYCWHMKKRFNLILNRPLRRAHITFINDSSRDIGGDKPWKELKKKWNGKVIEVELDLVPKTDGTNWWFTVVEASRKPLHDIRGEVDLGRPYWGLHMTIGSAGNSYDDGEKGQERIIRDNLAHSKYLHELAKKGLI